MKLLATFILLTLIIDALLWIAVDATEEAGIKHSEAVERYLSRFVFVNLSLFLFSDQRNLVSF